LLLDVGGVGYELEAPLSAFFDLPRADTPVSLFTHLVVREDAQLLYGFRSRPERELFRALIRVNGVGPKLALALLSGIDAPELVRCIQEGDVTSLTRLPGVGKKTAERLIIEMRDRIAEAFGEALPPELARPSAVATPAPEANLRDEAEGALIALGYKPAEASRAVAAVTEDVPLEELIRQALKGMVSR
jgi:Holliday junction DNA helicase RuvA